MEKRLENGTLLDLPSEVRDLLVTFKTFKRGDKYKHRKYHEFAWGERSTRQKGTTKGLMGSYHTKPITSSSLLTSMVTNSIKKSQMFRSTQIGKDSLID